jgi:hypothetical protein
MPAPRLLLLTFEPPDSHAGGQNQLRPLIQRHAANLVWYSIQPPRDVQVISQSTIPYQHGYLLSRPNSRHLKPFRDWINFHIWSRYLGLKAAQFGRKHRVNLIWAVTEGHAIPACLSAAQFLKVPLMLSIMDDPVASYRISGYTDSQLFHVKRMFTKLIKRSSSRGVISKAMSTYYREEYDKDSLILYVGADTDKLLLQPSLDRTKAQFTIGSVGRIYGYLEPEWQALIEAVRQLNAKHGAHKFCILHIGELPARFTAPEVKVTGWLEGRDYNQALEDTDLSLSILTFAEQAKVISMTSFPTKISSNLEAQRPILAFSPSYSSTTNFVNEYQCGVACTELNPGLLAAKIEELLFKDGVYEASLKGIAAAIKHYSREQYFTNFEALVKQTLTAS